MENVTNQTDSKNNKRVRHEESVHDSDRLQPKRSRYMFESVNENDEMTPISNNEYTINQLPIGNPLIIKTSITINIATETRLIDQPEAQCKYSIIRDDVPSSLTNNENQTPEYNWRKFLTDEEFERLPTRCWEEEVVTISDSDDDHDEVICERISVGDQTIWISDDEGENDKADQQDEAEI